MVSKLGSKLLKQVTSQSLNRMTKYLHSLSNKILEIIHRPVFFYLKRNVSETESSLLNVVLKYRTGTWIMSRILLVMLTYHLHKSIDLISTDSK
jgi:hypothetical protein